MNVSIITATYNSSPFIEKCLESIANQSHHAVEHIVIDGSSTDGTMDLLRLHNEQISILLSEPDNGIYSALNKGISLSTGSIVGFLHADDVFAHKNVLSDVVSIFHRYPNVDVVIGDVLFFNSQDYKVPVRYYCSSNFHPWMLRFGFMPAHTASFMRSSLLKRVGPYREDFKSAGDFEYFLRLFLIYKIKPFYARKNMVFMLNGGTSSSGYLSYKRTTNEIICILNEYQLYSNRFFIYLRLPIKLFSQFLFRLINRFL